MTIERGDPEEDYILQKTDDFFKKYTSFLGSNLDNLQSLGGLSIAGRDSEYERRVDRFGRLKKELSSFVMFGIYKERGFLIDLKRSIKLEKDGKIHPQIEVRYYMDGEEALGDFEEVFGHIKGKVIRNLSYDSAKERIVSLFLTSGWNKTP